MCHFLEITFECLHSTRTEAVQKCEHPPMCLWLNSFWKGETPLKDIDGMPAHVFKPHHLKGVLCQKCSAERSAKEAEKKTKEAERKTKEAEKKRETMRELKEQLAHLREAQELFRRASLVCFENSADAIETICETDSPTRPNSAASFSSSSSSITLTVIEKTATETLTLKPDTYESYCSQPSTAEPIYLLPKTYKPYRPEEATSRQFNPRAKPYEPVSPATPTTQSLNPKAKAYKPLCPESPATSPLNPKAKPYEPSRLESANSELFILQPIAYKPKRPETSSSKPFNPKAKTYKPSCTESATDETYILQPLTYKPSRPETATTQKLNPMAKAYKSSSPEVLCAQSLNPKAEPYKPSRPESPTTPPLNPKAKSYKPSRPESTTDETHESEQKTLGAFRPDTVTVQPITLSPANYVFTISEPEIAQTSTLQRDVHKQLHAKPASKHLKPSRHNPKSFRSRTALNSSQPSRPETVSVQPITFNPATYVANPSDSETAQCSTLQKAVHKQLIAKPDSKRLKPSPARHNPKSFRSRTTLKSSRGPSSRPPKRPLSTIWDSDTEEQAALEELFTICLVEKPTAPTPSRSHTQRCATGSCTKPVATNNAGRKGYYCEAHTCQAKDWGCLNDHFSTKLGSRRERYCLSHTCAVAGCAMKVAEPNATTCATHQWLNHAGPFSTHRR